MKDTPSHLHANDIYNLTWFNARDYVSPPMASETSVSFVRSIKRLNKFVHDQQIQDFALVHWGKGNLDWTSRVRTVDHYNVNTSKGMDSVVWKVPAVKNVGYVEVLAMEPHLSIHPSASSSFTLLLLLPRVQPFEHTEFLPAHNITDEREPPHSYYSLVMKAAVVDEHGILPDPSEAFVIASSDKFVIYGGPRFYPGEIAGVVIGVLAGLAIVGGVYVGAARYVRKRRSLDAANFSRGNNGVRYTDED